MAGGGYTSAVGRWVGLASRRERIKSLACNQWIFYSGHTVIANILPISIMKDDFCTDGLLDQFIFVLAPERGVATQEGISDDPCDISECEQKMQDPMDHKTTGLLWPV